MPSRFAQSVTPLALLAVLAGTATAQPAQPSTPKVQKVDQGVADAGPLNRSLLQVPVDTRVDDSFRGVYEVRASKHGPVQYMRTAGGLHAVFPQSEYVNVSDGILPVTPAGVVFWIGEPPDLRATTKRTPPTNNAASIDTRVYHAQRIETNVSTAAGTPSEPAQAPQTAPQTATVEDQSYRLTLLWRLAQEEKARLGVDDPDSQSTP